MLLEADPIIFFDIDPHREWILNLFNLPLTINNYSLIYMLAEGFSILQQQENKFKSLTYYCDLLLKHGNFESFSLALNYTFKLINSSFLNLDPLNFNDEKLSKYYLKCNQIGGFHIYPPIGAPDVIKLRSMKIDIIYYRDLCSKLFGTETNRFLEFNINYGGLKPIGNNMIFTYYNNDLYYPLGYQKSDLRNEIYVFNITNGYYGGDFLNYNIKDSDSLKLIRNQCIQKIIEWINNKCKTNCLNGNCILNKCICLNGYNGEYCNNIEVSTYYYKILSIISTFLITILVIFLGIWSFINYIPNLPYLNSIKIL